MRQLDGDVRAGHDGDTEPGVGLLPLPGEARRRRAPWVAELRVELAVADGGLDRGQDLAPGDGGEQRQLEAPRQLPLVAATLEPGDLLVHVLAEQRAAVEVDP